MMKRTELRTERLLLRPFRMEDVDDVLAYEGDEEFSRFVALAPWPYTRDDAVESCKRSAACDWRERPVFAIELAGSVAGSTNLILDLPNLTAELGYAVAPTQWGRGIAREAVTALLDWAFPGYGLDRVLATTDTRNERSWRLLERLGFTRDEHLRGRTLTMRGEFRDEFVYGLLREDWDTPNDSG